MADRATRDRIQITRIDPPMGGVVLTKRNIIVGNVLTVLPVLFVLAGIGGMAFCGIQMEEHPEWMKPKLTPEGMALIAGMTTSGILFVGAIIYTLANVAGMANRFLERQLRKVVRRRMDAEVRPDTPGSVFIEIVPRANINRAMLETATDVGYALADPSRRRFSIEGDKCRYVFPGGAIAGAALEEAAPVTAQGASLTYHYVVLRAHADGSIQELLFRPRTGSGKLGMKKRIRQTQALVDAINALAG